MDLHELLKHRFIKAIHKITRKPRPLIGEKWFSLVQKKDGLPVFQFSGASKLAKAIQQDTHQTARLLVENLNLDGLDCEVTVSPRDGQICLHFPKPVELY